MTEAVGKELARGASEILFDRGTLVDLYIGKPTFQRKLKPGSLLLADVIDESVLQLGNKRLMPKDALATHVTLEGQARAALAAKSIEFPISGARFVTYRALPDLIKQMRGLREQWRAATEEFVKKYDDLRKQQLEALDKQTEDLMKKQLELMPPAERNARSIELLEWQDKERAANRELYPDVEDIPTTFHFSWRMFKVSALEGGDRTRGLLSDDDIQQAQEEMKADLRSWVRTAVVEAHKALGAAAKNARDIFERQGKLHPRNLRPIFEAFETFNAIDFTGRSDWRQQVEAAKNKFIQRDAQGNIDLEKTAEGINGTTYATGEFKQLLDSIGSLAVEQTAQEAGLGAIAKVGEFKRLIEV
jgi:hypothetical protein